MEAVLELEVPTTSDNPYIDGVEATLIENEAAYEASLALFNQYMERRKDDTSRVTIAEHRYFRSIAMGLEQYEKHHFPIPTFPESLLQHFPVTTWDGEKLRRFRAEFDLTIDDVAKIVGLPSTEILTVEQGGGALQRVAAIALDRLDAYIRDVLHGED
jgi:DNA-binding XRE family transcriptional regulator